jgi:hypothetical protein
MSRPLDELIQDHDADSTQWEVIRTEALPSTNRRNRGGLGVQELLRHKTTGEEIVRHTLLRPDGKVFRRPHFRLGWK